MDTSKKIHARLTRMAAPLKLPTGPEQTRDDLPSIEKFIKDGLDPIHAAYAFVQNIASFFSEVISQFSEMKQFAELVEQAEDEYPLEPRGDGDHHGRNFL